MADYLGDVIGERLGESRCLSKKQQGQYVTGLGYDERMSLENLL